MRGLVNMGKERTGGLPNNAVETLAREHVIRAEPRAGVRWYEITHDRLIQPIRDSNRSWNSRRRRRLVRWALAVAGAAAIVLLAFAVHSIERQRLTHARFLQAQKEVRQANEAWAANRFEEALTHFNAAVGLYGLLADQTSQADNEARLGAVYSNLNRMTDSQQHFEKAYELHRAAGNSKAAGDDEATIGWIQLRNAAFRDAIKAGLEAIESYSKSKNRDLLNEGWALNIVAWSYFSLADYSNAADYFSRGRATLDRRYKQLAGEVHKPDSGIRGSKGPAEDDLGRAVDMTIRLRADSRIGLGAVNASIGQSDQSIRDLKAAMSELRLASDQSGMASVIADLGYAYLQKEDYRQALALFIEAETTNRQSPFPDPAIQVAALADQSVAYVELGQYRVGLEKARLALQLATKQNDRRWQGYCLWAEAIAYLSLGEREALQTDNQALKIAQDIGDRDLEARSLDTLGTISERMHNFQQALDDYRKAVGINQQTGNDTLFARNARKDLQRLLGAGPEPPAAPVHPND
jgi:tetratricopeptide (TPR) repeat protein